MQLYSIHCGFYDEEVGSGIYEFHVNFFAVAPTVEAAKKEVRSLPVFLKKKMHVDGVQEIKKVSGYKISALLESEAHLSPNQNSQIDSHQERDL